MVSEKGRKVKDLLTKYQRATEREARLRVRADQAALERATAVAEIHAYGLSYAEIADNTGLSRSRVQQLVERGIQQLVERGNR